MRSDPFDFIGVLRSSPASGIQTHDLISSSLLCGFPGIRAEDSLLVLFSRDHLSCSKPKLGFLVGTPLKTPVKSLGGKA